ncbi:hypothetical protein [Rhizobium ruizarguesonis]|uniref:hypothetical protein n=1 Tax=Rhizobium ruizarguesonis TaxID=2081791 RepID=UPI0013E0963A|nr:hypothetical protein [Rhizobium ruizarguesonis]NEJ94318.1 hypothetical protein [Rhizobium ruizarguesonis]
MASPDFSEFTFGYAVTRHIEEVLGGRLAVPNFPTQVEEADLGYDVDFLAHGVPLVIQYKRSSVMKRRDCKEFDSSHFAYLFDNLRPFFRMNLHKHHRYQQHMMLRAFERIVGGGVLYCTSSVPNKMELDGYYRAANMFEACTFFTPLGINIPDVYDDHFVSFHPRLPIAYVFSEQGMPFRYADGFASKMIGWASEGSDDILASVRRFIEDLDTVGPVEMAWRERVSSYESFSDAAAEGREIIREWTSAYDSEVSFHSVSKDMLVPFEDTVHRYRRSRPIRKVQSLFKRLAYEVYLHMDAFLVSVPRERLK